MICKQCGIDKPIENFSWRIKAKALRQIKCKECSSAYERSYREPRRSQLALQMRQHYSKEREKLLAQKREYYQANKETIKIKTKKYYDNIKDTPEFKQRSRRYTLKSKFGLTLEDYDNMLKAQHGACAICGNSTNRVLAVDHSHSTGKIRGLLCVTCNSFLGRIHDNPSSLISYLQR